jgi:hypothetical protein
MMVGNRLSINLLLNTMDGLLCLLHYPLIHRKKNPNAQANHVVSPIQSSHASKRPKTDVPKPEPDKGKGVATPSMSSEDSFESMSSHLILKENFPHVINESHPQGSNQPKAET